MSDQEWKKKDCRSRAFKQGYSTRYSLMITATGKPGKEDNTSYEIAVNAKKGWNKAKSDK